MIKILFISFCISSLFAVDPLKFKEDKNSSKSLVLPKPIYSLPMLLPPPPLVPLLDSMSLNDFVHFASKSIGKNILVSGQLNGSIDFVSNKGLSKGEVLSLLRSALELNGYSLASRGSYYVVYTSADSSKFPDLLPPSFSSRVFHINYNDVLLMLDSVRALLSPSGSAFGVSDSKSIVVNDSVVNIAKIEKLLSSLDRKPVVKEGTFKSFRLLNSSAVSVADTLKSIFSGDKNVSSLSVSSNIESNTVFVNGDTDLMGRVSPIIDELDREQYQVYIQVRIIELNNELSSKIGLKYGLDGGILSSSDFLTFSSNLGGTSVAPVNTQIVSLLSSSLGNVKQLLMIGASLDLLKSKGVSKTISNPSLLCLNNKESRVTVGKSISFLKGSTTGAAGTTNSVDRSDVGLNLIIKPLVSSRDKLTLSIDAILENILPNVDSNNQPITSKQQIKTDSILHHGETIVLGGFVKSYDTKNTFSVPFLSDLPFIGGAFKHDTDVQQTDNLLLVITPYIVDNSGSLSKLQMDLGILGNLQKTYSQTLISK